MKRTILVSIIYLMAYAALLALIRSELGTSFLIKIFVPATILFSFNLAAILAIFSRK